MPLHPAQLYESMAELIIFAFLYKRFNRLHRNGDIIGWYLVLYSSVRFLVEFFRNHEQNLVGGLSLTQWISLGRCSRAPSCRFGPGPLRPSRDPHLTGFPSAASPKYPDPSAGPYDSV